MKWISVASLSLLLAVMQPTLANGNTTPSSSKKCSATASQHKKLKPQLNRYNASLPMTVTVYSGSLKNNIQRIARNYGWNTVVWNAPSDYTWVGTTQISANTLADALSKILANYPVQAQFYQGNHVLVIAPRNLI